MNWKRFVIDVLIIGVVGFFQYIFLAILLFSTLSPFFASVDFYLNEYYNILQGFLIIGALLFFEFLTFRAFWKHSSRLMKVGLILVLTMGFLPFLYSGFQVANYGSYYQDFDSVEWKKEEVKPKAMVRTIITDSVFVHSNKEEVLQELGGEFDDESNTITFPTNLAGIPLIFQFDDEGELIRYYLRQINW